MTPTETYPLAALLDDHTGTLISSLADRIRRGALFCYPTETIYGIGGSFSVSGVRERIFSAKRRPADSNLILIAPDFSFFSKIPLIVPDTARLLAAAFWPGPLTLVLQQRDASSTVGIRVTRHPFIDALFRHLEDPIYSTSANVSGAAYVNDPAKIAFLFAGKIDFFVKAGPLPASPPSTVVRADPDGSIVVLREGAIDRGRIIEAAGGPEK
jgi:L-threonylcarbamoyladenylate synthase